jgi:LmbE family N-acetylglucosaminyl deacetylase|tara:strand:- start:435 stop:1103 length:669 start_codon:yes stop_codon:yes gene_type:complete
MEYPNKIVVIAPHPDDETLGVGGTIARLAENGTKVYVLIVSGHLPPIYDQSSFDKTHEEAIEAFKILGVDSYDFLKVPATLVNQTPVAELNAKIDKFVKSVKPDWVFIPFPDRHIDHRVIFDASVVACRPVGEDPPKVILAYETLSETHWNVPGVEPAFVPEFFIDISQNIDTKLEALKKYASQISKSPSRSTVAVEALAKFRGSQNGCSYAEAFKIVRIVI